MTRAALFLLAILAGCAGGPETVTLLAEEIRAEVVEIDCQGRDTCGFLDDRTVEQCVRFDAFCVQHNDLCGYRHTLDADAYNGCLDAIAERTCPEVERGDIPSECISTELNEIYQILVRD